MSTSAVGLMSFPTQYANHLAMCQLYCHSVLGFQLDNMTLRAARDKPAAALPNLRPAVPVASTAGEVGASLLAVWGAVAFLGLLAGGLDLLSPC